MEAIFQFVDEVVEAQRDTYCAIADDIWDHPETRFEEFWSAQRLADARGGRFSAHPRCWRDPECLYRQRR
ncbi:hypothetical protein KPZU09_16680 [Klebsiella pneumoniae]|uniref:Amidohydrolase n=1 Tax=Klebsiella pneumoniae TaxID=573 RepID=A0A919HSI9_KLEPN|nr:hypothetical protein KPZU09_16680 [Klebsiella pneumoniae]